MLIIRILLFLFLLAPLNAIFSNELDGFEITKIVSSWLSENNKESNVNILPEKKYPKCLDLDIKDISTDFSLLKISCQKPNQWSFVLRNKIKKKITKKNTQKKITKNLVQYLAFNTDMPRGSIVKEDDLVFLKKNISNSRNLIVNKSEIIGKKLKRSIRSNTPIYNGNLEKEWLIRKNDKITIENNLGTIIIKVEGIALENADHMEKIKVRNVSSGQIINAYVENKKKVIINPKQF
tara:strand:- start:545 stop:1252 length:708 start_codon:yes stop_codon:yes gene_type:complete